MDKETQILGELLATRAIAHALFYALANNNVVPRDRLTRELKIKEQQYAGEANSDDMDRARRASVAAVRLAEFIAEFHVLTGGSVQ